MAHASVRGRWCSEMLVRYPLNPIYSENLKETTRGPSLHRPPNRRLHDPFPIIELAPRRRLLHLQLSGLPPALLSPLILPILQKRALEIPKDWFVLSIGLSTLSAIVSVTVYPYSWEASGILGFSANFAATIATVQLIEGTDAGIKATLGPFYSD
ncbi:MAG: hypothetical protein M1829_003016 [Trizodia sp. TS-e1964]|nr:MAG: hypothetical protein M1829_003016 [Trizodia sp. TS-e1964]